MSMSGFFVFIGGLLGNDMGLATFATLPNTLFVISTALHVSLSTFIKNKWGKKALLFTTLLYAVLFLSTGILTVILQNKWLLFVAALILGGVTSGGQRIRFLIQEEAINPENKRALLSLLMLMPAFSSPIGTSLAEWGIDKFSMPYLGSFVAMLIVPFLATPLIIFSKNTTSAPLPPQSNTSYQGVLPPRQAIISSSLAYMLMSFLMVATSIKMVRIEDYSLATARSVIMWHLIAMYVPSLLTFYFKKISLITYSRVGFLLMFASGMVAYFAHNSLSYHAALILLGIGWNFLFYAGTSSVAHWEAYHNNTTITKRHDQFVFSFQAMGSALSGIFLYTLGWNALAIMTVSLSLVGLTIICQKTRRQPAA